MRGDGPDSASTAAHYGVWTRTEANRPVMDRIDGPDTECDIEYTPQTCQYWMKNYSGEGAPQPGTELWHCNRIAETNWWQSITGGFNNSGTTYSEASQGPWLYGGTLHNNNYEGGSFKTRSEGGVWD